MDNKIDCIVKEVLLDEVKSLSSTEDIFYRIEEKIKMEDDKRSEDYKHYSVGFGYKKHISIAACLLIICTTLMLVFSPQTRAFASRTISSIKTIFVLEKEGDKLKIVEKPSNEVYFTTGSGRTTRKGDKELSKKLGFNVRFPAVLGKSFRLKDKSLGVVLRKQVDYETSLMLENDRFNAIEDDNVLNQLKPYNAVREISGTYSKQDLSTIFISVSKAWKLSEITNQLKEFEKLQGFEVQKVKVGDLDGYWVKAPCPYYPIITENGLGKSDMSVQPEIKEKYTLSWEKSDIFYSLNTDKDYMLTLEESLKIAEDFMKAN